MISQDQKSGLRNPWLLSLLGLIVLVLAVNATFIWFATHNKSMLVDREYKTKDRKTNTQVLSELGAQQALAWQTTINKPKAIVLNQPTMYEISVADKDGKAVSGEMEVEAYRASDASKDFTTAFKEVASELALDRCVGGGVEGADRIDQAARRDDAARRADLVEISADGAQHPDIGVGGGRGDKERCLRTAPVGVDEADLGGGRGGHQIVS
jgi:nitrogen fixation protein FixH